MASPAPAYGGATFIADASAWTRAHRESVEDEWTSALSAGQIATCPIVTLELLRSTRDGEEFDRRADELDQLRDVPITRSVTNAARHAYRRLAHVSPLHHRAVKLPDLLIAAAAEGAGVGVLHYDEDFDRLAAVMSFESRWIAPRGSLA
jgi:predicted nucleic acid-binding protein